VAAVGDPRIRALLRAGGPLTDIQREALGHPDPWARKQCLDFLDHRAADASTAVFLAALDDPVAPVREIALHSVACERCRSEAVCVTEVVPRVIQVLERDPSPEVRYKTLTILRGFAARDASALDAIRRAVDGDPDAFLREGARIALEFGLIPSRHDLIRRLGRRGRAMAKSVPAPQAG
jgi:hypothetical protein